MKLLISTRKGLMIYAQHYNTWQFESVYFPGIPITLSYYHPYSRMLWAFQDHGHWGVKMSRSADMGFTWQEVEAPKYPEGEEVKDGQPASLRYIWAVHHGGPDHPETLWIGTVPGGLFKTEDNGATWQLNRPLWDDPMRKTHWFGGGMSDPGIHSIIVDPRDAQRMFIGISCAGVYETRNGGASWHARNKGLRADFLPDPNADLGHDPHLVVACPAAPDHLWQQNHCGVFYSPDGAMQWRDVTQEQGPVRFGFAVAVDENRPQRAWVIPGVSDEIRTAIGGALCVCRTDDGGASWTELRNGLPQSGSFDIVYRHGMALHGNDLVFGTTTGNVFYSRDQGESWETLTNYLPMVLAVAIVDA